MKSLEKNKLKINFSRKIFGLSPRAFKIRIFALTKSFNYRTIKVYIIYFIVLAFALVRKRK